VEKSRDPGAICDPDFRYSNSSLSEATSKQSQGISNMRKIIAIIAGVMCSITPKLQATPTDTTKKTILASTAAIPEYEIITREANVVFPNLLHGHETASAEYVEKFAEKRRDYLIRTYKRGKRFFDKAAKVLKQYNLPAELKVLLALESGFNANAVSSAGAVGYWQFMDEVAKEYGLHIVPQPDAAAKKKMALLSPDSLAKLKKEALKDDRRNFNKSTRAAARYLRDRTRNLGNNWLLIVASYNWGVGHVWNAMAASGKSNPDFWDIKDQLPAETRAYVLNFITLNVIFANYDKFLNGTLRFKPELVKVPVTPAASASTVSAGIR
jgi:Transglycosylase SLT domain